MMNIPTIDMFSHIFIVNKSEMWAMLIHIEVNQLFETEAKMQTNHYR